MDLVLVEGSATGWNSVEATWNSFQNPGIHLRSLEFLVNPGIFQYSESLEIPVSGNKLKIVINFISFITLMTMNSIKKAWINWRCGQLHFG